MKVIFPMAKSKNLNILLIDLETGKLIASTLITFLKFMYLPLFSGKELSSLQRYILSNKITSIYLCDTSSPKKEYKKKLKIKLDTR